MNTETVLGLIANSIALVATIYAAFATKAAREATREARRSTQAQLLGSIMDAYASPETLAAMKHLRDWEREHGQSFALDFQRLRHTDYVQVRDLDHARRRVSSHFYKIHVLKKQALLTDDLIREVFTEGQAKFYREVLEPLEEAIEHTPGPSCFDALGALYGVPRSPLSDIPPFRLGRSATTPP